MKAMIFAAGLGSRLKPITDTHTVIGESMSAGRIYDKIGDTAKAKVVLVTPHGTICNLSKKSLIDNKPLFQPAHQPARQKDGKYRRRDEQCPRDLSYHQTGYEKPY